jgi:hypothetical protein
MLRAATAAIAIAAMNAHAQNTGDWTVSITRDRMTDAKVCHVANRRHPNVVYDTTETLTIIPLPPARGVKGFQYRIDRNKASEWKLNSPRDGYRTAQIFSWKNELADGSTLFVKGLSVLDQAFEQEINLRGLKSARAKMLAACGLEDPYAAPAGEAPPPPQTQKTDN